MLDKRQVEAEEERLRQAVMQLPDADRKRFYDEVRGRLRDPDTYATANYSLLIGMHHFYLGNWARGIGDLLLGLTAIVLLAYDQIVVGLAILLTVVVTELSSLFRSELIVQDYNNRMYRETLERIQPTRGVARTAPGAPGAGQRRGGS